MNPPPPALIQKLVHFFPKIVIILTKDCHGDYYKLKEMIAQTVPVLGFLKFLEDSDTSNMIKTIATGNNRVNKKLTLL